MRSSLLSSIAELCALGEIASFGFWRAIQRTTRPLDRSSSAILGEFHKLHQARLPSRVATTPYGKDDGMIRSVLTSNCCSTAPLVALISSTLSARLFATSSRSFPPEVTSASPPG